MDLVRYAAPGDLAPANGEASYASIDGGRTEPLPFDSSPGGDPGVQRAGVFRTQGGVTGDITLAGYTTADAGTRLTVAYGNIQSTTGMEYMTIHAA